jgi:ABC-type nitrate/sulfonate/bicarbonate transport system ATPase subunit
LEDAIRVINIEKAFPVIDGFLPVLNGVSLDVPRGSLISLIGPSGCGKTTLTKIMAGLFLPDSGEILTSRGKGDLREQVAYMPQRDTLLPWRTALDNAILASEIEGRSKVYARAEARDLFYRFGLEGFEGLYPAELSGGMRQRLTLIRTFLAHREVLLLDEPLGSLDALTRAAMQEWLLSVWEELGESILFVTHDVEEAVVLSDQIVLLSARPAYVRERFLVDFPRPRKRSGREFVALKGKILDLVHAEGFRA